MITDDVPDPARSVFRLLIAALVLSAAACAPTPVDDDPSFAASLAEFRAAKDHAFKQPDSPIPHARQAELLPLAYFPGSLDYRVPAVLRVEANRVTLEMPTSTGERRQMQRVGTLEFTLKGQSAHARRVRRSAARNIDQLFVPFTDLTSGTETYPAGRYLDLDRTADRHLLDRLQPRLQPVLLLQPDLRLPLPAAREPPESADPRRREDEGAVDPDGNGDEPDAVVFDFDGVLADSEPLHLRRLPASCWRTRA